jgi:hypothetical protein
LTFIFATFTIFLGGEMKRKNVYDECPEVSWDAAGMYNIFEQLDMAFLIGRHKALYRELMETGDITATKANIVAMCHLISENNRHLMVYLQEKLGTPLRL